MPELFPSKTESFSFSVTDRISECFGSQADLHSPRRILPYPVFVLDLEQSALEEGQRGRRVWYSMSSSLTFGTESDHAVTGCRFRSKTSTCNLMLMSDPSTLYSVSQILAVSQSRHTQTFLFHVFYFIRSFSFSMSFISFVASQNLTSFTRQALKRSSRAKKFLRAILFTSRRFDP